MTTMHFSERLIKWYHQYGRYDLPWQKNPTPYRVWVSEIMLQQTQVTTVIPYYERFMHRFPSIKTLAAATQDEVLAHWSGLGYYARARNLHKTAQILQQNNNGRFPNTVDALAKLPGIGESTAGAILSFAKKQFAVILDGNVKRVLTRTFAFDEPINKTITVKKLWSLATSLTPQENAHLYNQAIMDLGATICTRTKPKCSHCPFESNCLALAQNQPTKFPIKAAKKKRPVKQVRLLIITNVQNEILLCKRPETGIWAGLWSFPECDLKTEVHSLRDPIQSHQLTLQEQLPVFTHQLTHYVLEIYPTLLQLEEKITLDSREAIWYTIDAKLPGGIPAPINNLLKKLGTKA